MNIHTRPATAHCGLIISRICREGSDTPQFLTAAEALGAEPEEAVFVGDHPWDDISGAKSTSMRTVLPPQPRRARRRRHRPDARITRLPELVDLVSAWPH